MRLDRKAVREGGLPFVVSRVQWILWEGGGLRRELRWLSSWLLVEGSAAMGCWASGHKILEEEEISVPVWRM